MATAAMTLNLLNLAPVRAFHEAVKECMLDLPQTVDELDETEDWRGLLVVTREDLEDALNALEEAGND